MVEAICPRAGLLRLVAVVVTHDRRAQLQATLARLLANPATVLAAVVVVDNASADGTAEFLAAIRDSRLDVLRLPANTGGAGGFAAGMRRACEAHAPDWVVVMDDDARPVPGALAAFHAASKPEAGLAAAVRFPGGAICEMNRPSLNPFWHWRVFLRTALGGGRDGYHIPPGAYEASERVPVDLTSFVGLFLPVSVVREVGYPDASLFLYGDDVIYALRLRRAGVPILFDPAIRFEHDCGTYADDRTRVLTALWKVYYIYRNVLIMYREAAGPLFWPLLLILFPKWVWKARAYGAGRHIFLRLMMRGVGDALWRRQGLPHGAVLALAAARAQATPARAVGAP